MDHERPNIFSDLCTTVFFLNIGYNGSLPKIRDFKMREKKPETYFVISDTSAKQFSSLAGNDKYLHVVQSKEINCPFSRISK